jgi:CheY-like chemotaxis protein
VTQAHGGQAAVESAGAGQGATFTLTLPIAAAKLPSDEEWPAANPDQLTGFQLLLVDDDADARDVARAALGGAGAIVDVAAGADEALARCRERRFDAVVCDVAMPAVDGYEFLRRLRERDAKVGRFTPAIALSAFADHDAETRALTAGFQRFIAKPYDFRDLVTAVAGVVRK